MYRAAGAQRCREDDPLINIICGIVTASQKGEILVDGRNWQSDFRYARERIGLVPQELDDRGVKKPVWNTSYPSRAAYSVSRAMTNISRSC